MIKAIIMDVDGVIVGEKIGYNSPHPHHYVLNALKKIRSNGIPVVLCTAKPHYAIPEIIKGANLHNPHITDAGAVIFDPIDNILVEKHTITKELSKKVIQTCILNKIYIEFYTLDNYFIQSSQISEITDKHTHILQRPPKIMSNLIEEIDNHEVTKIMPIALNEEDRKRVITILETYKDKLSISWGVHPIALPLQFGIITALGSSKKEAAEAIAESLEIPFKNILGIGDSTSDWSFIQLCGYGATLDNGSNEIKKLIESKGEGNYFIGKSVDQNGILEILQYFFSN